MSALVQIQTQVPGVNRLVGAAIDVAALGKVAVLMGGDSAEREVSLMSAPACWRRCSRKA